MIVAQEDKDKLKLLQLQICATEDLRCLFVLLLRCYNPSVQSRQYLQDLIVTNHILLLFLDGVQGIAATGNGDMLVHIKQYVGVYLLYSQLFAVRCGGNCRRISNCAELSVLRLIGLHRNSWD